MAEYISRDAVFQVVHGIARKIADKDTEALKAKDMKAFYKIKGAKEILDSVDTDLCYIPVADVQPVDRWISLKDKLPDEDERVLLSNTVTKRATIGTLRIDSMNRASYYIMLDNGYKVNSSLYTHWQPLPEPPKDGDE